MRRKQWILLTLVLLLTVLLFAVMGGYLLFREELQIMNSIQKLDTEQPVYVMEYTTDYHLEEIFEQGASSDEELASILSGYISHGFYRSEAHGDVAPGCSTFTAETAAGNVLWGRNFDWGSVVPIIVKSAPETGYASISTCAFSNITGEAGLAPDSFSSKMLAVAALYIPMDGINEKGLCVADLEVNEGGMTFVDTEKPNITVTMAVRLLLNKAATVKEAVALLKQYDIAPSGGISHHLAIADAAGKSVSVEFVKGKIVTVETPYLTNFNLANQDMEAGGESARDRYLRLKNIHDITGGRMEKEGMVWTMEQVAQNSEQQQTQWTLVSEYDPETLSVDYYFGGRFDQPVTIELS